MSVLNKVRERQTKGQVKNSSPRSFILQQDPVRLCITKSSSHILLASEHDLFCSTELGCVHAWGFKQIPEAVENHPTPCLLILRQKWKTSTPYQRLQYNAWISHNEQLQHSFYLGFLATVIGLYSMLPFRSRRSSYNEVRAKLTCMYIRHGSCIYSSPLFIIVALSVFYFY